MIKIKLTAVQFYARKFAQHGWAIISLLLRGLLGTVIIVITLIAIAFSYLLCLPLLAYGSLKKVIGDNH